MAAVSSCSLFGAHLQFSEIERRLDSKFQVEDSFAGSVSVDWPLVLVFSVYFFGFLSCLMMFPRADRGRLQQPRLLRRQTRTDALEAGARSASQWCSGNVSHLWNCAVLSPLPPSRGRRRPLSRICSERMSRERESIVSEREGEGNPFFL